MVHCTVVTLNCQSYHAAVSSGQQQYAVYQDGFAVHCPHAPPPSPPPTCTMRNVSMERSLNTTCQREGNSSATSATSSNKMHHDPFTPLTPSISSG